MIRLGVNVDHVATIREARKTNYPDPVRAAILAELAGCNSIVVHLREDRRHIQERDVRILKEVVQTRLNLEMAATDKMVKFARELKPDQVTLVPERREELTTEGGLNVVNQRELLQTVVNLLQDTEGIDVSLFIDPDPEQIKAAHKIKARIIELHTGRYCESSSPIDELQKLEEAVKLSHRLGLQVSAGHGLNYQNVKAVAKISGIEELNIGHSIVARAVLVGMERAVREMIALINP
ncbi:MAG: pyridoxine 5'-phosphate synthase [bacterium]|nr:pyridoxine 5'-phosphate synthase [bacterium]